MQKYLVNKRKDEIMKEENENIELKEMANLEDKLIGKQVKKEDGSLFEKIIAECISGIAETVLEFTTRRKSKCRF